MIALPDEPRFLPLVEYRAVWADPRGEPATDAVRAERLRWIDKLPECLKRRGADLSWEIRSDAILADGRVLGAAVEAAKNAGLIDKPAGFDKLPRWHQERELAARNIHAGIDRITLVNPAWSMVRVCAEAARQYGELAAKYAVKMTPRMVERRAARIAAGQLCYQAVGRVGRRKAEIDPRLVEAVNTFAIKHGQSRSMVLANVNTLADQLGLPRLTLSLLRRIDKSFSKFEKVRARGNRSQLRKLTPNIRRSFNMPPLGLVGFDGVTLNIMAGRVMPNGERKRQRATMIVFKDARTRILLPSRAVFSERVEDVLIGCKEVCKQYGTPVKWTMDRGGALTAAFWNAAADRVGMFAGLLNSEFYQPPGRTPTSRGWDERFHRTIHDWFGRDPKYARFYWGATPADRPDAAEKHTRDHVDDLPTDEELTADFNERFIPFYNEQPHSGRGMDGLSPRQAWDQYFLDHPDFKLSRHADALIDFAAAHIVGPCKIGPDGIRFRNEWYGSADPAVLWLQGRSVFLRRDPDLFGLVALVEADGRPICMEGTDEPIIARVEQLTDRTPDEFRDAIAKQKAAVRAMKALCDARPYLHATVAQTIALARAEATERRRDEERARTGAPTSPRVQLVVTPETGPAVKFAAEKAAEKAGRRRGRTAGEIDPFSLLAEDSRVEWPVEGGGDLWREYLGETA